jgi:stage 0 sporulation regulatory protein
LTQNSLLVNEVNELENTINQMKIILIRIAKTTGLNSHETLYYSQKLDELITIYQKLRIDSIQKIDQKSCIVIQYRTSFLPFLLGMVKLHVKTGYIIAAFTKLSSNVLTIKCASQSLLVWL